MYPFEGVDTTGFMEPEIQTQLSSIFLTLRLFPFVDQFHFFRPVLPKSLEPSSQQFLDHISPAELPENKDRLSVL